MKTRRRTALMLVGLYALLQVLLVLYRVFLHGAVESLWLSALGGALPFAGSLRLRPEAGWVALMGAAVSFIALTAYVASQIDIGIPPHAMSAEHAAGVARSAVILVGIYCIKLEWRRWAMLAFLSLVTARSAVRLQLGPDASLALVNLNVGLLWAELLVVTVVGVTLLTRKAAAN